MSIAEIKIKSKLLHALRAVGLTGLGVGSYALTAPVAPVALAISAAWTGIKFNWLSGLLKAAREQNVFVPHSEEDGDFQRYSDEAAEAFGISQESQVYKIDQAAAANFSHALSMDMQMEKQVVDFSQGTGFGAFKLDGKNRAVFISPALKNILSQAEQKAVVFQSMATLALKGNDSNRQTAVLTSIIGSTNWAATWLEIFASGALKTLAVLATASASYLGGIGKTLTDRLQRKQNRSVENSLADKVKDNRSLDNTIAIGEIGAMGLATYFNTQVGVLYIGTKVLNTAASIIYKHGIRSHVFAADKAAVEAGANPLALIEALRKIEVLERRSLNAHWRGEELYQLPTGLRRVWKILQATSPEVSDRIDRLAVIALEEGYEQGVVSSFLQTPVDIPKKSLLPFSVMKHRVKELL